VNAELQAQFLLQVISDSAFSFSNIVKPADFLSGYIDQGLPAGDSQDSEGSHRMASAF